VKLHFEGDTDELEKGFDGEVVCLEGGWLVALVSQVRKEFLCEVDRNWLIIDVRLESV